MSLQAFARHLAAQQPAVAAAQARHLARLGLAGAEPAALAQALAELLAPLAAGQPVGELTPAPTTTSRREAVLAASALELALLEFLPGFTADVGEAVAIAAALREVHAATFALGAERFETAQRDALRRSERQKDEFLGMISHELRTPIHVLTGFGGVLLRDLGGPLAPAQRGYLAKMMDVTRVLGRLVDDLIDLAQVGAGAFSLDLVPLAFAPLARETLAQLAPLALEKGITLHDEVPATLPAVRADGQRIHQVLSNLLVNAIKFTPAGGAVRLGARVEDGWLHVEVADTGVGIAAEDLAVIFQRFIRRGPETGGMGLGLAISQAIVAGHGGAIAVESEPGRGSRFHFGLPLAPAHPLF
ncbi:MAG: two-component sensor histidine kinase [Cyanobacteria bacterium RYN_339]|nr:two-component sensor histidine kinase [Cyanobacteria bacterium RYN_339]